MQHAGDIAVANRARTFVDLGLSYSKKTAYAVTFVESGAALEDGVIDTFKVVGIPAPLHVYWVPGTKFDIEVVPSEME